MKSLFFLASLAIVGCSGSGPPFAVSPPQEGSGQVVIYRKPSTPAGRASKVFVDGKLAGRLPQKGYLTLELQPGYHSFNVTFDKSSAFADVSPASQTPKIEIGRRIFLRYRTEAVYGSDIGVLLTSPGLTTALPSYTMRGILEPVSPGIALPEVSRCKMAEQDAPSNR